MGSAEHRRARAYLTGRLQTLGLEPAIGASFELSYAARDPGADDNAAALAILLRAVETGC